MFKPAFKSFFVPFIILVFLVIFITCFFSPTILGSYVTSYEDTYYSFDLNSEYVWPTPGYTSINSYFGRRNSPTAGASTYHKGIDIGAPQGSSFIAICKGKITYTGFLGGGGYTITLSVNNMKITYCHVSPNYIVKVRRCC